MLDTLFVFCIDISIQNTKNKMSDEAEEDNTEDGPCIDLVRGDLRPPWVAS